jgi:hypothetical protein
MEFACAEEMIRQCREAILGIVERDAFNKARQYFLSRGFLLWLHHYCFLDRQSHGIVNVPDHMPTLAACARSSSVT